MVIASSLMKVAFTQTMSLLNQPSLTSCKNGHWVHRIPLEQLPSLFDDVQGLMCATDESVSTIASKIRFTKRCSIHKCDRAHDSNEEESGEGAHCKAGSFSGELLDGSVVSLFYSRNGRRNWQYIKRPV